MADERRGGSGGDPEIDVRAARPEDRHAVIELCRTALGWAPDDPSERFFAWKHDENPFGVSPAWVAEDPDRQLLGVRVLMRWRFRRGGRTLDAVRAVDTATHPDAQGRGIFTRLTLGALPELADAGIEAVFNTPNDQSRPGYLKMGWQALGRVPVAVRPRSPAALARMAGANASAAKWSEPSDVGLPASAALASSDEVARLLERCGTTDRLHTDRSSEYLQWRYRFPELHYRAIPLGDRTEDGLVIARLRRRGTALEAAVCEVLDPSGRGAGAAVAWLLRRSGADYALRGAAGATLRSGFLPVPQLGPVLTWRPLGGDTVPRLDQLSLALGDVELF